MSSENGFPASSAADVFVLMQLSRRAMQRAHEEQAHGVPIEAALGYLAAADAATALSGIFAAHDAEGSAKWNVIAQLRLGWARRECRAAGLQLT
jgi:hypothetical protein